MMAITRAQYNIFWRHLAWLVAILSIASLRPQSSVATEVLSTADPIIDVANKLRLYDEPEWLALGHYRRVGKGWRSTIDDPHFFLAEDGKIDPKAELLATIRAFFAPSTNAEEHATNRFVARFSWVNERCDLANSKIPDFDNSDYKRLLAEVKPTSIILAFPAPSADGVSSAFGHVFLVFAQADRSCLLAPTVSYAALVDENVGPLSPVLGLTGGFKGYFTALPHADKMKEYNSVACRDVWEYELNLTPKEVERIFQHAWELRHIFSRYYFLDENCAYGVLSLLNVGRPGLCPPSFDRRLFIFPLDVVRLVQQQGLVKSTYYAPSVLTTLRTDSMGLSGRELVAARAMAFGKETPKNEFLTITNSLKQAAVLNVAMSRAALRVARGEISSARHKQIMAPLIEAIQGRKVDLNPSAFPNTPPYPETAHRPSRLKTGAVKRNGSAYWLAGVRPAYHDHLDPSAAMNSADQLQIMGTEVLANETGHIAEWQLCIFDMETLKPSDALYAPLSRKLTINTIYRNDSQSTHEWNCLVDGGLGVSYALLARTVIYSMGEIELQTRNIQDDTWLGLGPAVGIVSDLPFRSRVYIQGRYQVNTLASDRQYYDLTAGVSVAVTKRMSLVCQYSEEQNEDSNPRDEFRIETRLYF